MIALPLVVALLIRWWPHTPLGKLILNEPPPTEELLPESLLQDSLIGDHAIVRGVSGSANVGDHSVVDATR